MEESNDEHKHILKDENCKLILTCRLQVFRDKGFVNLRIFKTCECNLSSEGLSLTTDEKEKITSKFFGEHAVKAMEHLGEYDFLPLLCKLYYGQKTNLQCKLDVFLKDPFSFYQDDLTDMYNDCKEGKYKYCALLLIVIFNNKVLETDLTGKDAKVQGMIEDIIDACEIDENVTVKTIKSQLEILIGTFVTYEEGIYQTIHDKLFDFLAFYFGTQHVDVLISHAKVQFVHERFLVAERNVTGVTKCANYVIPIYDENLEVYTKRVFDDLICSSNVNQCIRGNKNFQNEKFHTMFVGYTKRLNKNEITELIKTSNSECFNKIFVLQENDIKYEDEIKWKHEYQRYGIVIPDDMLQLYTEKWFEHLTNTDEVSLYFNECRALRNVVYYTTLQSYIRQLSTEKIASLIETCSKDFIITMFVMTENDILHVKDNIFYHYKCFGIVIPDDILQQYIQRLFDDLTKTCLETVSLDHNRPLMKVKFRSAVRNHMRQFPTNTIASIIQAADDSFFNTMFVMTEEDIKDDNESTYAWFSIVIPDDLLQKYINRWLKDLNKQRFEHGYFDYNKPMLNVTFRRAANAHLRQLTPVKIASIIQTSNKKFFNTMFVMSEEDIKHDAKNKYECVGIVIPDDLLQQYMERWLDSLRDANSVRECIVDNRPSMNVRFSTAMSTFMRQLDTEKIASIIDSAESDFLNTMFVMTENDIRQNTENIYECFGIVIPDNMLHKYIETWLDKVNFANSAEEYINANRPLNNVTFRTAFQTYMWEIDTKEIGRLMQTGYLDFLNTMFVVKEEDIKYRAGNKHECFGIFIPDDMLQHYIERWFNRLKDSNSVKKGMADNRPLMNVAFQTAMSTFMRQLDTEKIASIIDTAEGDFLNTMFVMTENDIRENAENINECFGIVIPDNMLHKYIEAWLDKVNFADSVEEYINANRPLKNVTFRIACQTYMRNLDTKKIGNLIQTGYIGFLNTMFIMTEEDIKDNADNKYECLGIIITENLLHKYIERWFYRVTRAYWVKEGMDVNRLLSNATFRTAMRTYMTQLDIENIDSIIHTTHGDFINVMFVMTEEDIRKNAESNYECIGIVIPGDLLQHYIESWLDGMKCADSVKEYMNVNRPSMNVSFRTEFHTYNKQLSTQEIGNLIQAGNIDFLNTMFVMTEDDIKDNSANRYESFGILIPEDLFLFQLYIETWFECLTKANSVMECMNANRPLMNITFRTALQIYMSQLLTEDIRTLIQTGSSDFLNTIFVLTDNEIMIDNDDYQFECFGIVIPDDMLQQYTSRWIDCMTKTDKVLEFVSVNRSAMSVILQSELAAYMN